MFNTGIFLKTGSRGARVEWGQIMIVVLLIIAVAAILFNAVATAAQEAAFPPGLNEKDQGKLLQNVEVAKTLLPALPAACRADPDFRNYLMGVIKKSIYGNQYGWEMPDALKELCGGSTNLFAIAAQIKNALLQGNYELDTHFWEELLRVGPQVGEQICQFLLRRLLGG